MFSIGEFSVGALIAMLFGAFLGHTLAIRRGKFQKKHEAAILFKQVLIPVLNKLKNGENQFHTMQNTFDDQHHAAILYSAYLDDPIRSEFLKELKTYSDWREEMYGRSREEVLYHTNSPSYLAAQSVSPTSYINKLLGFART